MSNRIHALFLQLDFPSGIAAGEGGDFNRLVVARNGRNEAILRGTSLAGVLRHRWRRTLQHQGLAGEQLSQRISQFFGQSQSAKSNQDSRGEASRLRVSDSVLTDAMGQPLSQSIERTHHLRNRHTGAVADGGLYSLEACPPGSQAIAALWLEEDDPVESDDVSHFLETIVSWFDRGLRLGGKSNRGLGLARLAGPAIYRAYDLTDLDQHAQLLDDRIAWKNDRRKIPGGSKLAAANLANENSLVVHFKLAIPRGQDVLIADGQGFDHEMEPQRVIAAEGKSYWRIPGSTLRGLFRSWVTRLASRDGKSVADSADRQAKVWGHLKKDDCSDTQQSENWLAGDNLGWCFVPKKDRTPALAKSDCPIANLFGSLIKAGRIHISDALAPRRIQGNGTESPEEQLRMHVAVDRITGGAAESMLFDNTVLTAYQDGKSPCFEFTMIVDDPREDEARWLAATLRALDLGVLRVGSSKSSGRLELAESPLASGPFQEQFSAIKSKATGTT